MKPAATADRVDLRLASFPRDLAVVRALFAEYAAGLEIDLSFQGFAAELDGLPGAYAAPNGAVLLAEFRGEALGCVAVRPHEGSICEMKRLYVRPAGRGRGLGDQLVSRICDVARTQGYRRMRLDTLATMTPALRLYLRAGFHDIPAYIYNPVAGARYLERDLAGSARPMGEA